MSEREPTTISGRLEWLRHYLQMTQREFAESLNVLPTTYSNWLSGYYGPSLDGARRLRDTYGVSLDWIYYGIAEGLPRPIKQAWDHRP